ncbi:hypothetical protein GO299_04708 [Ralstonia solanacearum]|nr:hypothetical protein [Ralstonia solanacearum]NKF72421.1 hypothetical protein [Ralstonia solanacearum]
MNTKHTSEPRDPYTDYWEEALSLSFDAEGLYHLYEQIPADKRMSIAKGLATSAENQGMAFGHDAIPNPMHSEMSEAKKLHAEEIKRLERLIDVYRNGISRVTGIEEHRLYVNGIDVMVSRN